MFTVTFELSTTSLLTDHGCEGDSADIKTPETSEQNEIFPSRATGARSSSGGGGSRVRTEAATSSQMDEEGMRKVR